LGVLSTPQQVGADVLNDVFEAPDKEECADNSLFKLLLPQKVHLTSVSFRLTNNSLCFPQSWHLYSYKGIHFSYNILSKVILIGFSINAMRNFSQTQ
jgi:hypothetical protein